MHAWILTYESTSLTCVRIILKKNLKKENIWSAGNGTPIKEGPTHGSISGCMYNGGKKIREMTLF